MTIATSALNVIGSGLDPYDSTLLAGAAAHHDGMYQGTASGRIADLPPLSAAAEDAIGDRVRSLPVRSTSSQQLARALWETATQMDRPICVWDAPAQLTLLHQYLDEGDAAHLDSMTYDADPDGPLIVDVKVLDRWLYPDRRGRRTIATTARFWGIEGVDGNPEDAAMMCARIGQAILADKKLDEIPAQALLLSQRSWHRESTEELRDWLVKQHRPTRHLDYSWPLREPLDPVDEWTIVDDWLDGHGSSQEAREALLRIRRNK